MNSPRTGRVPLVLYEYLNAEHLNDSMSDLKQYGTVEYGFFGYPSNLPLIVASASSAGTVGTLISVDAWSRLPGENKTALTELHGGVRCAVNITGAASPPDKLASLNGVVDFVSIVALPLSASKSDDPVSDALINSYAGWLKRSTRRDIRYRLAAVSETIDPRHRFTEIIKHVKPQADQLAKWIAADAVSRDKALTSWLDQQH